ncbi:hypothetical protein K457DRAFT_122178 [Linnemannia elongata AG-77]|uniref:PH domain-containing protein n=1 Tax=Linnemannia elongata AG-77 TaxID=1314771 RepID=A0A197K951_9FUNG|nr:hypothetical protein K457DRAFT_122178 [Linnemannia elongata AG-77]
MPTALLKLDRPAQWGPRPGQDSGSIPCPLYSGHLLKLGSNDRWQSRLFTFDGSVLICVGKKPKAPVIMTYDPYVSSPFQSPSCHPRPLNPNTKWYIEIASITAIKLLPVTKIHRCFPYSDTSKELSIQTNDGRNMTLRASKDVELERWYFVLSKIWELQHQTEHPVVTGVAAEEEEDAEVAEDAITPYATKHLAAHQQSAQLFQRYLQKQYQRQESAESPRKPPPFYHHLRPQQKKKPRESFLPYEIPPPPRVSAFLPQGFEWSLQEQGDEDDFPIGYNNNYGGYPDTRSASDEQRDRRPMERQTSWSHHPQQQRQQLLQQQTQQQGHQPLQIQGSISMTVPGNCHAGELHTAASAEMYHQRFACPAASSMEPRKAAIIDNWRRSLHQPLHVDDTGSSHVNDSVAIGQQQQQRQHQQQMRARAIDQDLADLQDPSMVLIDSRDLETALKRTSILGLDMAACNNTESGGLHSATIVPSPITDLTLTHWVNNAQEDYSYAKNEIFGQVHQDNHHHRHQAQDDIVKRLSIIAGNNRSSAMVKEEDELPLGLLQSNRHSRWLNTQLSSYDGASNAPREQQPQPTGTLTTTTTHQLLPSEPITPERTPAKNLSALSQLDSLAPAAHLDSNSNLCYIPIAPISSSASSSKIERAPFTVHVPKRQLRRCPSIPPSSVNITINKPKKYIPIDTTPYTTISSSLPHHPPPRPPRPPSIGLNSLAGPDELKNATLRTTFNVNINNRPNNNNQNDPSQNNPSPPLPPPADYTREHSQNRLSLSRSISANSTQVLQQQQQQQQQQDYSVHPYQTAPLPLDDDEDEDEPLALTLSRQQSLRQRQTRSQMMQRQQQQQPPMPAAYKGILSTSGSISQLPVSHLQCYEQVTPAASSESVIYY